MTKGFSTLFFSLLPLAAFGWNYDVQVGQDGLTYTPDRLFNVQPGDTVTFKFHPKNHTVTQSSFKTPCSKLDYGADSGFRPVAEGVGYDDFVFDVESTKPAWFYCRQKGHCIAGMVFALNAEDDYQVEEFQENAKETPPPAETTTDCSSEDSWPSTTSDYAEPTYYPEPVEHRVEVGLNGLNFTPPFLSANIGDTVTFVFHPKNHTATQSTFDDPCVRKSDGFDSGFMPVDISSPLKKWSVTVNDTKPVWVYCKQRNGNHCGTGMVFAINSDETGDKSFAKFQENAKRKNGTVAATTTSTSATKSPSATSIGSENPLTTVQSGALKGVYASSAVLAVLVGATVGLAF